MDFFADFFRALATFFSRSKKTDVPEADTPPDVSEESTPEVRPDPAPELTDPGTDTEAPVAEDTPDTAQPGVGGPDDDGAEADEPPAAPAPDDTPVEPEPDETPAEPEPDEMPVEPEPDETSVEPEPEPDETPVTPVPDETPTEMPDHGDMPGHGMDYPVPPGIAATAAQISTYLGALAAMEETRVHDQGHALAGEHDAALALVPRVAASHVAIGDGDWDDPAIWSGGEVPGDDASVLIPPGVTVSYGHASDARIFTVRVDGKLAFDTDVDSRLVFDTMIVSPGGHLEIGTADDPVDPSVTIDLVVADNGPIDTDWDPDLLSRGLISHGRADIHGAVKDSHEKASDDPMEGDTSVTFDGLPEGWQVGDSIVIAGTNYEGHKWDNDIRAVRPHASEDEVRVISGIDGDTVYFDEPLAFDHATPREDLKTSVANYTRNVSIESESGAESEIFARGHVMFMHSDQVDVRYAEFSELGRTDKSEDSFPRDQIDGIAFDSNVQGRYALHLHRTGVEDIDNPTMLQGNAVFGSPGWGIVHHDSNAVIDNNATFDTFGAGYVAETGNETGAWTNNIAIYAEGQGWGNPKNFVELDSFDTARSGDGFWFQGRLVDATDNVAASVNVGFSYFHRNGDDRMIENISDHFAFGGALDGETEQADDVPIRAFSGNETFASNYGLHVVKANPNQGHDVWSHLQDFTAWEVRTGAHLEYTSHYILENFDLIAKDPTAFSKAMDGISFGTNTTEMVVADSSIDGFPVGVDLRKFFTGGTQNPELHDYFVINTTIDGETTAFENYDPAHDVVLNDPGIASVAPSLDLNGPLTYREGYPDPGARHVEIDGSKTDALGTTQFPGGTDGFDIGRGKVTGILEDDGYWTTTDGQAYFLLDVYVTDRLSGDVYVEHHPVWIDGNVSLGNEFSPYGGAKANGVQDITEMADGTLMAGDVTLGVAERAVPFAHLDDGSGAPMDHEMSGMLGMRVMALFSTEEPDAVPADAEEMDEMSESVPAF